MDKTMDETVNLDDAVKDANARLGREEVSWLVMMIVGVILDPGDGL